MRESIFGDCEYGEDVAPEHAFDLVQVDLFEVGAHGLLRGVIDQYVDISVPMRGISEICWSG